MINSENMDKETQKNLINLLKESHLGLIQLNTNLLTYDSIENIDKISVLVDLFKELLNNLDSNLQKKKIEENTIIEQPKGIDSIINMEGINNIYNNISKDCMDYTDCKDCIDQEESCPTIIDDETKDDCKKYTNNSIIFNTFRVIKKKFTIYSFM